MSCASSCASFLSKSSPGRGAHVRFSKFLIYPAQVCETALLKFLCFGLSSMANLYLCSFKAQDGLSVCRCSFNRIVVTALDTDVNIISPTSNRHAYLMTCGHPCEPAGLLLDLQRFMLSVLFPVCVKNHEIPVSHRCARC